MSKSTPINQLPNILLNDPQRQIQSHASPEAPPPLQDPEEIIQETLAQLNAQTSSQNQPIQQQAAINQSQQQPQIQPDSQQGMGEFQYDPNMMQPMYDPNAFYAPMMTQSTHDTNMLHDGDIKSRFLKDFSVWNGDVQVAIFVAAFYIVLSMLPIESLIYRYIALNKIPYSGIVIKAVLMFVVVIVLIKVLKN
jgi:hypothetical protein